MLAGLDVAAAVGVATAAATAAGYRQHRRDDRRLASGEELQVLLKGLRKEHAVLSVRHRSMIQAWRGPLSLFGEREARAAAQGGVPAWAVACAGKARRLAAEAAELIDFADLYESQLAVAMQDSDRGKGVLKAPLCALTRHLADLSRRFNAHTPCLELARRAFDSPSDAVPDGEGAQGLGDLGRRQDSEPPSRYGEDLPVAILRDRGRLGELWRRQGRALGQLLAKAPPEADEGAGSRS